MDFFVVPTVRFQLLNVWFVLDHDRRRLIHFNVTTNPTASWVTQQLREAFPSDNALLFLLYDRDSIFSVEVTATIRSLGTEPLRTAYRSPWQNPFAERWVGTCRRELLDHVVVLSERHLRRLLAEWRIPPSASGYVGDSPFDVRAAREVGVVAVAAAWDPGIDPEPLAAEQPDFLFQSVEGFAAWAGRITR